MLALLRRLRHKCAIGYVSGSSLIRHQRQLGSPSIPVTSLFDYCFSENGLVAFKLCVPYNGSSLIEWMGETRYKIFISWVLRYIADLDIPIKRGTFVEFRTGMVNISPMGQGASHAEMDEFQRYDKVHGIRKGMVAALEKQFPDWGLMYSIGGQSCFDAFPIGWDKRYCLKYIEAEKEMSGLDYKNIHFFGDSTWEGGNDHELYEDKRTIGHRVVNPDDTMRQIKELFDL